ncbi:MAG: hypothetical protein QF464_22715, partial [Myxococcota bacterium]|nr:hypothetical protein [Myxococcota bacterium]
MTSDDRWAHGSEFHWPLLTSPATAAALPSPWAAAGVLSGSGRDALRLVLAHGRRVHGWRRLWVPSYLCQDVVAALVGTGLPCVLYADAPTQSGPDSSTLEPTAEDVVLLVNYFGLRGPEPLALGDAAIIVDHTHDPWSPWAIDGTVDYAVASLRKTLPIPDGGVLWSPKGLALPDAPPLTTRHAAAAEAKWKAMRLKGHYLAGEMVAEEDFRGLALEGEAAMGEGEVSGIHPATATRLGDFPAAGWRERRRRNHHVLAEALEGLDGLTVLSPRPDGCPFSGVLVFDAADQRERVRQALVAARSHPSVLWPMDAPVLEGVSDAHRM